MHPNQGGLYAEESVFHVRVLVISAMHIRHGGSEGRRDTAALPPAD